MPSVELRLHRYFPADRGSEPRPRRPDPAFAYPSRALCLETHQTRPYPRNHRPEPVRTCSRLQSGRTFPGRLTIPTCLPAPRAAVGNHSKSALRQQRSARRYKSQPLWYAASRSSILLIRTCCRARMPCASRLAAREPVPTVACVQWRVAWVPCAARSAQAAGNLARDPPTNPTGRRSLFLACATSAGPGCAGWPRCAAITHRLPGSRPATPTKPVSPTLCGGPGDARWVHGRRPCLGRRQIGSKARGNTSSCINQVKSPDQEPGLTRLSTSNPRSGAAAREGPTSLGALLAAATALALSGDHCHWHCSGSGRTATEPSLAGVPKSRAPPASSE